MHRHCQRERRERLLREDRHRTVEEEDRLERRRGWDHQGTELDPVLVEDPRESTCQ